MTKSDENWLYTYISDAINRNLCTMIHCTTCGAKEFRLGLLDALSKAAGKQIVPLYNPENSVAIAAELARLPGDKAHEPGFEDAVQLILCDIWSAFSKSQIEPLLQGTWAGDVLARMKVHYQAEEEAWRARKEYESPARVQQRREEKRRQKQEKHAERLALKKERDRIWWETHRKDE